MTEHEEYTVMGHGKSLVHFRVSFMWSNTNKNPHCRYVFLSKRDFRELKKCERRLWETKICEESLESELSSIKILYILGRSNRFILFY